MTPTRKQVAKLVVPFALLLLSCVMSESGPISTASPDESAKTFHEMPWAPLSSPDPELSFLRRVLDVDPEKRLTALQDVYDDKKLSQRIRGLAAFASGREALKRRQTKKAVESFGASEIMYTELSGYALYSIARELESSDSTSALKALTLLEASYPNFQLIDEARILFARLLDARGDKIKAVLVLKPAVGSKDEVVRGRALEEIAKLLSALGRNEEAVRYLEMLYYELPGHDRASNARRWLVRIRKKLPEVSDTYLYGLAFNRAQQFVKDKRYHDAYKEFASILKRFPNIADTDLVRLRMAISQYHRRQLTASIANFKRVDRKELVPEALFYRAEVARRLQHRATFFERVSDLEKWYPDNVWTERALWSLGQYYETKNKFDLALQQYEKQLQRFPMGAHATEANWRIAWRAFRTGRFEDAGFGFEIASRDSLGVSGLGRCLYWAGRSYQKAGRLKRAEEFFHQVVLGFQNSYYGRKAIKRLGEIQSQDDSEVRLGLASEGIVLTDVLQVERKKRQRRIAELFVLGYSEQAALEAETAVTGYPDDIPFHLMAAWIRFNEGRNLETVVAVRDAFPFLHAATGDLVPKPIWKLFYPLVFRDQLENHATDRGLDPYLVAALIRQESVFNPFARSRAGARGLMQVMPATGRQMAREERRRYTSRDLFDPNINIRYGTLYLNNVLKQFKGRIDYALAAYNAGPTRVKRWTNMDMSIDPEIFIEEIPFDETRNYVKLVLRNEMLYRRLYGGVKLPDAAAQ